jgi:hypothetical protein
VSLASLLAKVDVDKIKRVAAVLGGVNWKEAIDAVRHPTVQGVVKDVEIGLEIAAAVGVPYAATAEEVIEVVSFLYGAGLVKGADAMDPAMLRASGQPGVANV